MSRSLHIAGLKVTPLPLAAAVQMFLEDARAGRPRVYVFVNGHSAMLRRADEAYAAALEDSHAVGVVDGAAVELAGLLRGVSHIERCPGPDFFTAAAHAAAESGVSFYLLGGNEGVAARVAEKLTADNPALVVAGTVCPPFGTWDGTVSDPLIAGVHASGAQALWLGVSAPKQETWAIAHSERLGMPVACVGAAFDFIVGTQPRAPQWMRSARLEWLFRLVSEPKRLWRRYLVGNTLFIWDALRYGSRPASKVPTE